MLPAIQTQDYRPFRALKPSNQHNPVTLSKACYIFLQSRQQRKHILRPVLRQLLVSTHLQEVAGKPTHILAYKLDLSYPEARTTQRLNELVSLGYMSKRKQVAKHIDKYYGLRFSYFTYHLTKQGVRYLVDLFQIEDE